MPRVRKLLTPKENMNKNFWPTSYLGKLLLAYLFLFCLGFFGIHRFYLGRTFSGLIYLFSGGLCGVGVFVDIFLLPFMIDENTLV